MFIIIGVDAVGQNIRLNFVPTVNKAKIELDKAYFVEGVNDSIKISKLKFYITNVHLEFKDGNVFEEENSYHLMNLNTPESLTLDINHKSKAEIKFVYFSIGVDSVTNMQGVMDGDLDPLTGMYWSWNSGYINFKMEGVCKKSMARNQEFQFHVGGYSSPFNTCREIKLTLGENSGELDIAMNCNYFLNQSDLPKKTHIMSPGQSAYQLSKSFLDMFSIKN